MLDKIKLSSVLKEFIIGGLLVSGLSIVGNYFDPVLAGLLAGIPIGLPAIFFINSSKAPFYINNLVISVILLLIATISYFYMYRYLNWEKNLTIIPAMGIWFFATGLIYCLYKR